MSPKSTAVNATAVRSPNCLARFKIMPRNRSSSMNGPRKQA